MKVKITKEAKSYIKLADMPGIHEIIDGVKELDTKKFAKMGLPIYHRQQSYRRSES